MAASQLLILLTDNTTTITLPLPPSLASSPDGLVPSDALIQAIMHGGGFWDQSQNVFRPITVIKSITVA